MGKDSSIQWCDHTWPVTTGCDDESPGCLNCYSKVASYRMGLNPNPKISAAYGGTVEKRGGGLRWTGVLKTLPERLDWPLKWKKPARIFVGNMSDLFHPDVPDVFIDQVFGVMAWASHHTYQVLTKRSERMMSYGSELAAMTRQERGVRMARSKGFDVSDYTPGGMDWPLGNVWLGVSVEDQKRADERIPHLLRTPAAVRFLSVEPMLGPIDLREWLNPSRECSCEGMGLCCINAPMLPRISWVIVGGESGSRARPFDLAWARSIRDQCKAAGAAFFMKQLGSNPRWSPRSGPSGIWPDHVRFDYQSSFAESSHRIRLEDSHGGDPDEWSDDLRVREFPSQLQEAR